MNINIGKNIEDEVEAYLKKNNILYKKNVCLKQDPNLLQNIDPKDKKPKKKIEFDFIIPYYVIECKAFRLYSNSSFYEICLNKTIEQLKKQLDNIPSNYSIYLYAPQLLEEEKTIKKLRFDERIIIIKNLKQIDVKKISIVADSVKVLKSFASEDNKEYDDIINRYPEISITQDVYNKTIIYMSEEEQKRLNKFKINFIERDIDIIFAFFTNNKRTDLPYLNDYIFKIFQIKINYYELKNKMPINLLENYTKKCNHCDEIYKSQFFLEDKCYKCANIKLGDLMRPKRKKLQHKKRFHTISKIGKPNKMEKLKK
jgi:hypothetical protein